MNSKKWYLSKTLWFNVLFLAVGIASAFGYNEFSPDAEMESYVLVAVTIVNLVLRLVTKTAVTP